MKNWKIAKQGSKWYISWYNIKNEPMDEYPQKYNKVYQNNPKKYFKKIFKLFRGEYGIEFVHQWNNSQIIWETPNKLYWCQFRNSSNYEKKGKWCWKCWKQNNDHVCCG